jgi:hypothetical protein
LWAVHENVLGFDTAIIDEELGDKYMVKHLRATPSDVGFACVRRVRIYTLAFRKDMVVACCDIHEAYGRVAEVLQKTTPCIAEFLFATDAQLLNAENYMRNHRRLAPRTARSNDWSYLLTEKQRGYIATFRNVWIKQVGSSPESDANCIFDISQNPEHRPRTSARGSLPSLTSGSSMFWSPAHKRFMLPVELAAACGIPSTPDLAAVCNVPFFDEPWTSAQIGNGMHVANMGMFLAVALACLNLVVP